MARTTRIDRNSFEKIHDGKQSYKYGGKYCKCNWCQYEKNSKYKKRKALNKLHKKQMNEIY